MEKQISMVLVFVSLLVTTLTHAQVRDSLPKEQQSMVQIAALTGKGALPALKTQLHLGLDAGLTINQIKELMIHSYAYAGFPRSIRGLQTFMTVLQEREEQGITDPLGAEASPIQQNARKYDRGKAILDTLIGTLQHGPQTGYSAFAPTIELFLKEHLFADIFERDVLSYTDRELATIAVLSSIGGVEPMLKSHFKICLNLGITAPQLKQFITIIAATVGAKEAEAAQLVLEELL